MVTVHHLNCGWLHVPPQPRASCHCLLLETDAGLALVDTGIGLHDVRDPEQRLGAALIAAAGFQFNEQDTALRQLEARGLAAGDIEHVLLTHADPDHIGGLADFAASTVHLSTEEYAAAVQGDPRPRIPRYLPGQWEHEVVWRTHAPTGERWFGLDARRVETSLWESGDVLLVHLPGHTRGHCGIAVRRGPDRWLLHAGDAIYLHAEFEAPDHPVHALAAANAEDDHQRRQSVEHLRRLRSEHGHRVRIICTHDERDLRLPADADSAST